MVQDLARTLSPPLKKIVAVAALDRVRAQLRRPRRRSHTNRTGRRPALLTGHHLSHLLHRTARCHLLEVHQNQGPQSGPAIVGLAVAGTCSAQLLVLGMRHRRALAHHQGHRPLVARILDRQVAPRRSVQLVGAALLHLAAAGALALLRQLGAGLTSTHSGRPSDTTLDLRPAVELREGQQTTRPDRAITLLAILHLPALGMISTDRPALLARFSQCTCATFCFSPICSETAPNALHTVVLPCIRSYCYRLSLSMNNKLLA